jgi:hypothetical protein
VVFDSFRYTQLEVGQASSLQVGCALRFVSGDQCIAMEGKFFIELCFEGGPPREGTPAKAENVEVTVAARPHACVPDAYAS